MSQLKDQAGFRSNRSTADPLHTLYQLKEKTTEFNIPLSLAFIDFEKAFDSVEITAVTNALREQQIHPKYINTLESICKSSTSTIRLEREGPAFDIRRGVRQGDSISPKLLISCLESIFSKLNWNNKGYGIQIDDDQKISNLRFPDDIVLIAKNHSELQNMIMELHEQSGKVGLKMNQGKTKVMLSKLTPTTNIQIDDKV